MLSKIWTVALNAMKTHTVEIEADISDNDYQQRVSIVGLPDSSVRESKDRIYSALKSSGFALPKGQVTLSLSPADIRKTGAHFDLPMALSFITTKSNISSDFLRDFLIVGELALDGRTRPVLGCLSMAIHAQKQGYKYLIVPKENAAEAAAVSGILVFGVSTLQETIAFLKGQHPLAAEQITKNPLETTKLDSDFDFSIVKGQFMARRGLEVAAAGGHNILLIGSPGCGKSLMAKCFPSILPELSFQESLNVTQIHSIAGLLQEKTNPLIQERPFRSPHHTISDAGLIGGSQNPRPGEISLAHHGVLFLDELPEFRKSTLEVLRQPLESGQVQISRANGTATFPAEFTLLAAMNPCPCGYYGSLKHNCRDSFIQRQRYQSKISGPLLDRIDIQIAVAELSDEEMMAKTKSESSKSIRQRVLAARKKQQQRFNNDKINAQMSVQDIQTYCPLDKESQQILKHSINQLRLSARAYDRILKISRTIADLEGSEYILSQHLTEAIQYRKLDRDNN